MRSAKATAELASATELALDNTPESSPETWENTFYALSGDSWKQGREVSLKEFLDSEKSFMLSPKAGVTTRKALRKAKKLTFDINWTFKAEVLPIVSVMTVLAGIVVSLLVGTFSDISAGLIWPLSMTPGALSVLSWVTVAILDDRTMRLPKRLQRFIDSSPQSEVVVYEGRDSLRDKDGTQFYVSDNITAQELFVALTILSERDKLLAEMDTLRKQVIDIRYAVKTDQSDKVVASKKAEIERKREIVSSRDQMIAKLLMGNADEAIH